MSKKLRLEMPQTAKLVDGMRAILGAEVFNDRLRRAIKGEPGLFYAKENGFEVGTPDTRVVSIMKWDDRGIPCRTDAPWMVEALDWCAENGIELPPRKDYGCFDEATRLAERLRKILKERTNV
jgi:hypothetical protein